MNLGRKIIILAALCLLFFGTAPSYSYAAVPTLLGSAAGSLVRGFFDTSNACTVASLFTQCVANLIYYIGPGVGAWVVSWAAYFFDIVIQLSLSSAAYALQFLTDGWTVVRDIANMAFIFILIYIAFEIMLGAETAGTMRRLAWVIAIALIVNFSFFLTRVVIDAGNIISIQFYNAIDVKGNTVGKGTKDLTLPIMNAVGVQKLLGPVSLAQVQKASGGGMDVWAALITTSVVYLAVAAMFWILAFAFLHVGVKFMMRIVGLWFVIISSPLAFVSKTLKQTEKFFGSWLEFLIKFSFYPAIFLFMFLLLTKIAGEIAQGNLVAPFFNTGTIGSASTAEGTSELVGGLADVSIRLGLIVGMLYIGLKVADWVVQQGNGLAQKFTGFIGGAVSGVARFGGRQMLRGGGLAFQQGVGRGAANIERRMQQSERFNRLGSLWGYLGYRGRGALRSVAATGVGGARPYTEFRAARDTELRERRANIRDAETRGWLATLADPTQGLNNLNDTQIDRLRSLNARELQAFPNSNRAAWITALMENGLFARTQTEGDRKINTIQQNDAYSDVQKEDLYNAWAVQRNQRGMYPRTREAEVRARAFGTMEQRTKSLIEGNVAKVEEKYGIKADESRAVEELPKATPEQVRYYLEQQRRLGTDGGFRRTTRRGRRVNDESAVISPITSKTPQQPRVSPQQPISSTSMPPVTPRPQTPPVPTPPRAAPPPTPPPQIPPTPQTPPRARGADMAGAAAAGRALGEMREEREAEQAPTQPAPARPTQAPRAAAAAPSAATERQSVFADLWRAKRGPETPSLEPLTNEIRKLRQTIKQSNAEMRNRPATADRTSNIEKGLKEIAREMAREKPVDVNLKVNAEKKPGPNGGNNPPIIR